MSLKTETQNVKVGGGEERKTRDYVSTQCIPGRDIVKA